ncbi:hypothetical protein ACHAXT_004905 [Thalassiosira profunda]
MKSAMKRAKSAKKDNTTASTSPADLTSFSLAAAINEASQHSSQQQQPPPTRKIFSSPIKFGSSKNNTSQVSLATSNSFATANENGQPASDIITPASQFFVESSDEETQETNEDLGFDRDPLGIFSQDVSTPHSIQISNMPSKKTTARKIVPVAEAVPAPPAKKDPKTDEPHFDVAQNVYGTAKNAWAWGTGVPVVSTFLGLTETIAAKVLDATVHMDLPAIDQEGVVPQLKKLDDDIITPAILAVWKVIEPAVGKADEMVLKPVLTEVVPRVLAPLGMFDGKKAEEKKIEAAPLALN